MVSTVTEPDAGAVQVNHTLLAGPESHDGMGSPVSVVAPTVDWLRFAPETMGSAFTKSSLVGAVAVNVTFTLTDDTTFTVQVFPFVVSQPVHPVTLDPASAVAVNVNDVGVGTTVVHVLPQSIPAGDEVTLPEPVPSLVILSTGAGSTSTACAIFKRG